MDETMTNETTAEPTPATDVEQEPEHTDMNILWPCIVDDVKHRSMDAAQVLQYVTGIHVAEDWSRIEVQIVNKQHIPEQLFGDYEQDIIRTAIHNRTGIPEIVLNVEPETIELPLDEYMRLTELDYCVKRIAQLTKVAADES